LRNSSVSSCSFIDRQLPALIDKFSRGVVGD
jgi:hypothetical protein